MVCSRSIASVAMLTAVSKPKVKSVPDRSLSIVFGTPTTLTPSSASLVATPRVSSPPIATRASTPSLGEVLLDPLHAVVELERVGARGAEDGAAAGQDAAALLDAELHGHALERAAPAVAVADELEAVALDPLAHHRPDDGVQSGAVPASGEHSDAHAAQSGRIRRRRTSSAAAGRSRPAASRNHGTVGSNALPPLIRGNSHDPQLVAGLLVLADDAALAAQRGVDREVGAGPDQGQVLGVGGRGAGEVAALLHHASSRRRPCRRTAWRTTRPG